MSAQAQGQRARQVIPSDSEPEQMSPFGDGSSDPHITLSPECPSSGKNTTGFNFLVIADTCTSVTVWKRDPGTGAWGVLADFNNVSPNAIGPFIWASVCDSMACELWFETDATNTERTFGPIILVEETSG